jgi:hypothetical protein
MTDRLAGRRSVFTVKVAVVSLNDVREMPRLDFVVTVTDAMIWVGLNVIAVSVVVKSKVYSIPGDRLFTENTPAMAS